MNAIFKVLQENDFGKGFQMQAMNEKHSEAVANCHDAFDCEIAKIKRVRLATVEPSFP
jgi:hypothetical protein